jgi:hypothetical protein
MKNTILRVFTSAFLLILLCFPLIPALEDRIKIFDSGRIRLEKTAEISDGSLPEGLYFQNLRALDIHPSAGLFAADFDADHVLQFNFEGKLVRIIGRSGQGPGELSAPSLIAVSVNRLFVWETRNRRFSVFSTAGKFMETIPFPQDLGRPLKIRSLRDGRLVIESEISLMESQPPCQRRLIHIFSADLEQRTRIKTQDLRLRKLITKPMRMWVPQPFRPRLHWDVTLHNKIIIGDSQDYSFEILDPDKGGIKEFSRVYSPVKITDSDKQNHFSVFTIVVWRGGSKEQKQGAPDYIKENTVFPRFKPAFKDIKIDNRGFIWVQPHQMSGEKEDRFFDVFSPEGQFITSIEIGGGALFPDVFSSPFLDGCFWQIERSEEGTIQVIKYCLLIP